MGNPHHRFLLVSVLMVNSIPIVYYGQEQHVDGSGDPVRPWFDR